MSFLERALDKARVSREPGDAATISSGAQGHEGRPPRSTGARPERTRTPHRIVEINAAALQGVGVLPLPVHARGVAHQFRHIKRPLIATALAGDERAAPHARLIMVTSAMPGDGKTFTSLNLALSIALDAELDVVLVDADVAKPQISQLLGVEHEKGLLDVLRDHTLDVEDVILPTTIPSLSILPSGPRSDTDTELLASKRMEKLADALCGSGPSRICVFDSPPMLITSEAPAIAMMMGQIVLVISAGRTLQKDVLAAISQLDPQKHIGIVVNQTTDGFPESYYGDPVP